MSDQKIRRALISVYDKTGIVDFARALVEEFGIEIISTGGTAALLKENGIPVTLVEEITGFPEMLDGRVKTLHPKIYAAILADRDNPEHMRQLTEQNIEPIDMVVVNLYPFEETIKKPDCTFAEAIEMIDIGGVALLRAAAKNHKHVFVADDPERYENTLRFLRGELLSPPDTEADGRLLRASYAFGETCMFDADVAEWMGRQENLSAFPWFHSVFTRNWGRLRYGENPHQPGELLESFDDSAFCLPVADALWDTDVEMSFNNFADASAALELCAEMTRAGGSLLLSPPGGGATGGTPRAQEGYSCCFIKHANACGVGVAAPEDESEDATTTARLEAYRRAYLGDPNAAMGGILAANFNVDAALAEAVMEAYQRWGLEAGAGGFFVEVWVAPSFDKDAVEIVRTRKEWGQRVRLLDVGDMSVELDPNEMDFKRIAGGMLMQTPDLVGLNEDQWKVVTKRRPTEQEMDDLRLAWLVCKHTKSNAVSICKDGMLIGNGAGQMSRVMSCRIATWLAKENGHADKLPGSVSASDGFFPFRDGPDILIEAGITAIIQPGGSKRDAESIAACDEREVAMIFTGTRHFKH